jgi:3-phosphoshikimate 1-carboxyvinyltransferase
MAAPERLMHPFEHPVDADVDVVGSKSYTNRALVIAALARGDSELTGALFSDDTRFMVQSLQALGVPVETDEPGARIRVHGAAGVVPAASARCFVGNAGTAARFLPVAMALGQGVYEIDGVARMRERPIAPLLDALATLGVKVECLGNPSCFPLRVHGGALRGGRVTIAGNVSSQYISGLMMGGPAMPLGLAIAMEGELVSRPYLEMTAQAMRDFGARVERESERQFTIPAGHLYEGRSYRVEPDASAASYFFAAAAITGGRARVSGLGTRSLQGDRGFVHILERMGCRVVEGDDFTEVTGTGTLRGVEVDMADLSDVAQTLAVVAPFASSPTRVTGIGFIRHKETDRPAAVVRELNRVGVRAEQEPDGFVVHPGAPHPAAIDTYDDHRMAMSFALLGLARPGIVIRDPGCVSKTFPNYFEVLDGLRR